MRLNELAAGVRTLSLAGTCKNAGKTTVLGTLIGPPAQSAGLALTSIGRDGESRDIVTDTPQATHLCRPGYADCHGRGIAASVRYNARDCRGH